MVKQNGRSSDITGLLLPLLRSAHGRAGRFEFLERESCDSLRGLAMMFFKDLLETIFNLENTIRKM